MGNEWRVFRRSAAGPARPRAAGRRWLSRAALATASAGLAAGLAVAGPGTAMAAPAAKKPAVSVNTKLAAYAKTLEGIRYRYGGTTKAGFDCSGLTQYVYRHDGLVIPRTAQAQFTRFRRISHAQARPGDLVFFHDSANPRSYVYHVGIYEGGEEMLVAPSSGKRVTMQSFAWAGATVTFGTITH